MVQRDLNVPLLINIIMSVICINIQESVHSLKCNNHNMNQMVMRQLSTYRLQQQKIVKELTQILMSEIIKRDEQIKALKQQKQRSVLIISYLKEKESYPVDGKYEEKNSEDNGDIVRKYYELLRQNKQYEQEFANLMEEMKMIKVYVQQLKRVRSLRSIQYQNSPVNENSPVKDLNFEQQDKILTKISSLNRLQKIKIMPYLDTIREVTQMSAHTEQDNEQSISYKQKQLFIQANPIAPFIQSHLSQSFECTSEIEDITNILFDNNSQQAKSSLQNSESNSAQFYESFQHSLSVLKNYGGNQNIQMSYVKSKSKNEIGFTLPTFEELVCPQLTIKDIVNQRHIVFNEGFVYTGATVAMRDTLKPMGFGQLYFKNSLFYCGQWKDGVFDGWGKMFLPKGKRIKHFNGKWQQGIATGPCSIKFWNSDKFIGSLSKQQIHGQGTYFQQNKPTYFGYWQKNTLLLQEEY